MPGYVQHYDPRRKCDGVVDQADGAVIPRPPAGQPPHPRWAAFLEWNAAQPSPLDLGDLAPPVRRGPRALLAIRADLVALTAAQKNAIWSDLTAGNPPKWSTDAGPNAAAIAVLQLVAIAANMSAADMLEAKLRAAAFYCQDNPAYLMNPAFDATINVPGDQVVS